MGVKTVKAFIAVLLIGGWVLPLSAQEKEPDWVSSPPENSADYYIGIAGSNTGNKADDKEIARHRALTALASQISVFLRSESTITINDDGENSSVLLENSINQNVMQNLESIETVQVWVSRKKGCWYYLRLEKSVWEEIQKRRAIELETRISEMVSGTFRNSRSELSALERAYGEYREAFPSQRIKMNLFGERGSADTLLLIKAEDLLDELTIELDTPPKKLDRTNPVQLTGRIHRSSRGMPGSFNLLLLDPAKRILGEWTTEPNGEFSWKGKLDLEGMSGDNSFTIIMGSPFNNESLHRELSYIYPRLQFQSRVTPLIQLVLEINGEPAESLEKRGLSLIQDLSPYPVTLKGTGMEMRISIEYNDYPLNDFGLFFSQGTLYINISDGRSTRLLWESPLIKEGGLTADQAREILFDSLLDSLNDNRDLKKALDSI